MTHVADERLIKYLLMSLLLNFCGGRLLMLLSKKPQYRNDQVDVSDPYQDSSSGQCRMWREREHFDKY